MEPLEVRVRTVTVAGVIAPGTPFDPDLIAEAFWSAHTGPDSPTEIVYTGH